MSGAALPLGRTLQHTLAHGQKIAPVGLVSSANSESCLISKISASGSDTRAPDSCELC